MNIIKRLDEEANKARRQYVEQMETNGAAGHLKRREKTCRLAISEISRQQSVLASVQAHLESNNDPVKAATAALDVLRSTASLNSDTDPKGIMDRPNADIHSKEGRLVVFAYPDAGYRRDQEQAEAHLVVGNTYTVERTEVGGWHTDFYLKEVPNMAFNSVHFAPSVPTKISPISDKKGGDA